MEIFLIGSMLLLQYSIYIIPIAIGLIFFLNKRRDRKFWGEFILFGVLVTVLAYCLMALINWAVPNEKGVFGLIFGFWIAVFVWGYLLRRHFGLNWLTVIFTAILPISSLGYYTAFDQFVYRSDRINEEMKSFAARVNHNFKAFELSLADYKKQCGHYPEKLEFLFTDPKTCSKWEKSVYGDESMLTDPWNNLYIYKTDSETYYEISTLDADNKIGGDKFNNDFRFQGP